MVTRAYYCKACDYEFETVQPMHEKLKKKCPKCGKLKLSQDLSGGTYKPIGEVKSLGMLMEQNTNKMGSLEREDKERAVYEYDKNCKKQAEDKMRAAGINPVAKKDPVKQPQLSSEAIRAIKSGDLNRIQKYIYEGR